MKWIEQGWYNSSPLNYLLLPLSLLFLLVAATRRLLFKLGILTSYRVAKPVVIVGNISVGGNGKTPFVIWLVELLKDRGIKAGVVSRGYGGKSAHYPLMVDDSLDTAIFGDEPVLIHRRTGCPVVVGPDRVKNAQLLLSCCDCDIIVSDDGLQHYRLQRDIEVVIVDAARQFGNHWVMPVGPLRELKSRLNHVDYVVYNGPHSTDSSTASNNEVSFELVPSALRRVQDDSRADDSADDSADDTDSNMKPGHRFNAVCAIGNPRRFKNTLEQQGFEICSFTPFADHHHFSVADFAVFGEQAVVMTEKDAVKCQPFARPNWWYLPVDARLPERFEQQFLTDLEQEIQNYGI